MEVVTSPDVKEEAIYMYIVFEYMDYDFAVVTEQKKTFYALEIKYYMMQLLTGLAYYHGQGILYRDIKRAYILVGKDRKLKLADFGLSRFVEEDIDTENLLSDYPDSFDYLGRTFEEFSNSIMALSYRAPELLLGATRYGSEVDIWAVGCLFAELVNGGAKIFPVSSEDDHKLRLQKIFQVCGSPDEHNWPLVSELSKFDASILPNPPMKRRVREVFGNFDPHALDLLDKMLVLDPTKRISATDALAATYFSTEPLPDDAKRLPPYDF